MHESDCSQLACNPDLANETKEDIYWGFLAKIFPILKLPFLSAFEYSCVSMRSWCPRGDTPKEMKMAEQKGRKRLGA